MAKLFVIPGPNQDPQTVTVPDGVVMFSSGQPVALPLGSGMATSGGQIVSSGATASDNLVKLSADTPSTVVTFANLGNLSFNVLANTDYIFEAFLLFRSATATTGIAFAATIPASPVAFAMMRQIPISLVATVVGQARAGDSGAPSTAVDTINVDNLALLQGILRNGANAGVVQLRFASEVGTTSVVVRQGSLLRWRQF